MYKKHLQPSDYIVDTSLSLPKTENYIYLKAIFLETNLI